MTKATVDERSDPQTKLSSTYRKKLETNLDTAESIGTMDAPLTEDESLTMDMTGSEILELTGDYIFTSINPDDTGTRAERVRRRRIEQLQEERLLRAQIDFDL